MTGGWLEEKEIATLKEEKDMEEKEEILRVVFSDKKKEKKEAVKIEVKDVYGEVVEPNDIVMFYDTRQKKYVRALVDSFTASGTLRLCFISEEGKLSTFNSDDEGTKKRLLTLFRRDFVKYGRLNPNSTKIM